jgi:hypothetical protein
MCLSRWPATAQSSMSASSLLQRTEIASALGLCARSSCLDVRNEKQKKKKKKKKNIYA